MKHAFLALVLFAAVVAVGQNGPTAPSVTLTWTQSQSAGITGNCIYRGAAAGSYTLPALACPTTPVTTYKDTTVVAGQTYHWAVTALAGGAESAYSNDVSCAIPTPPAAPTNLAPTLITELLPENDGIVADAVIVTGEGQSAIVAPTIIQ